MSDSDYPKLALDKFRQWHFWWLVAIAAVFMGSFLGIVEIGFTQNNNQDNIFSSVPGQTSGIKAIFQITDSDYLNVTLKSAVLIEATVQSVSEVVSVVIQPNQISPVQLTFFGFIPNKTYYRYDNSFRNETVVNPDNIGSFSIMQDLSQGHHIWIQEVRGTKFIEDNITGGDCTSVGNWNNTTKICTLNQDLNNNIEITSDGITLDCNNHKLSDGFRWTSFAVLLNNRQNVTVKNCTIENASNGINAVFSNNNTFINNSLSGNGNPIRLVSSDNNTISGNTVSANGQGVALGSLSDNNFVKNNNISDILFGVTIGDRANSNTIEANTITGHSSAGIHIADLSNSNQILNNTLANNAFGILILQSNGTVVRDNTIQNNPNGVTIGIQSFSTKVFHNNFLNNTTQAQAFTPSSFDNGLSDGGNFWNNYDTSAEGCHNLNNDNFCDAPFVFTEGQDNFPWMKQDGWKGPPRMINPTVSGTIICKFHCYFDPKNSKFHDGIDIDETIALASIKAVAGGKIVRIQRELTKPLGAGKWIWIDHGNVTKSDNTIASQTSTRYLHMDTINSSLIDDQIISQSTIIGTVGRTGVSTDSIPHLHFETRQGDTGPKDYRLTVVVDPQQFVNYPVIRREIFFYTSSDFPNIIVEDPDGLIIDETTNQLPGLADYLKVEYIGEDENEGVVKGYAKIILNQFKIGDYSISVIPDSDSLPTDLYTLKVSSGSLTVTLAEDARIGDIPEQPHIVRTTGTVLEKIIPVLIRIEPETLNLSQRGIFTVFLQIPKGFGVTLEEIDVNTINLSDASPTQSNFNKGTDTLNLKFNTRDLVGISPGNQVTLTITGRLLDGTNFEGSDNIRIIKKGNIFSAITSIFFTLTNLVASLFTTITNILS